MKKIADYIKIHNVKILVTIVLALILDLLSQFPYFSAFLTFPYPVGKFFVLWIFISIYFQVNSTFTRWLSVFWLVFAVLGAVFQREGILESAGVACIMLLVVSFLQEWYEQRKKL